MADEELEEEKTRKEKMKSEGLIVKKILSLILIIVICMSLCACENGGEDNEKDDWIIKYYVDEFDTPTDEWYIVNSELWVGTFSDSATNNSELSAKVLVDDRCISLALFEYSYWQVKNSSTRNMDYYDITLKLEDGTQVEVSGVIPQSGERIYISQLYTSDVLEALLGEGTVQFYVEDVSHPITNYLFSVDCSNFAELYNSVK